MNKYLKEIDESILKFCESLKCECGKVFEIEEIKSMTKPNKYISHTITLYCKCNDEPYTYKMPTINLRVNQ